MPPDEAEMCACLPFLRLKGSAGLIVPVPDPDGLNKVIIALNAVAESISVAIPDTAFTNIPTGSPCADLRFPTDLTTRTE